MLLQPKFVLPEFFMHVQFPAQVSAGAGKGKREGFTTSVGPVSPSTGILSLPPNATNKKINTQKGRRDEINDSCSFPLENLFLQNASHHLESESSTVTGSNIVYEKEDSSAGTSIEGSDLQQTLMRKQAIVQALQQAVRDFKRDKDSLVLTHVRNIAAQKLK